MMRNFTYILSFVLLLTSSLPAKSQNDLNSSLRQAVCNQDWQQAISIIDQMIPIAPSHQNELNSYRMRLMELSNIGFVENWNCEAENTPQVRTTEPEPNPEPIVFDDEVAYIRMLKRIADDPVILALLDDSPDLFIDFGKRYCDMRNQNISEDEIRRNFAEHIVESDPIIKDTLRNFYGNILAISPKYFCPEFD